MELIAIELSKHPQLVSDEGLIQDFILNSDLQQQATIAVLCGSEDASSSMTAKFFASQMTRADEIDDQTS